MGGLSGFELVILLFFFGLGAVVLVVVPFVAYRVGYSRGLAEGERNLLQRQQYPGA